MVQLFYLLCKLVICVFMPTFVVDGGRPWGLVIIIIIEGRRWRD